MRQACWAVEVGILTGAAGRGRSSGLKRASELGNEIKSLFRLTVTALEFQRHQKGRRDREHARPMPRRVRVRISLRVREGPDEGFDGGLHSNVNFPWASLRFEAQQLTQLDLAAHQPDELLGGQPRVRYRQGAGGRRPLEKDLDLPKIALGPGAPEHFAEYQKSDDLADDDPMQGQRIGRQQEAQKPAAELNQRSTSVAGIQFAGRQPGEALLALTPDHGTEQVLFAAEMGVHSRL